MEKLLPEENFYMIKELEFGQNSTIQGKRKEKLIIMKIHLTQINNLS